MVSLTTRISIVVTLEKHCVVCPLYSTIRMSEYLIKAFGAYDVEYVEYDDDDVLFES